MHARSIIGACRDVARGPAGPLCARRGWNGSHAGIQVARQHVRELDGQGDFEYMPVAQCAGSCSYRGKCVTLQPKRPAKCM
jgi:hypothetical protein